MNLTRLILLLRNKPMLLVCSSVRLLGLLVGFRARCALCQGRTSDAEPGPILLKELRWME